MPREMKKVNGRYVWTGSASSSDLVPSAPAPRPPAGPRARPAASPRAKPKARPAAKRPWWSKILNDVQYELRQLPEALNRGSVLAPGNRIMGAFLYRQRAQIGPAGIGAADNIARMGYSLVQRQIQRKPKADPSSGPVGETLDRIVDAGYRFYGAKPPSQMTQQERGVDQLRRSIAANLIAAPLTPGFSALRGVPILRAGAQFAWNEVVSNYLDDQTGGNWVNLANQLTGLRLPGAVDVGNADMVDAANQSLAPNAGLSAGIGGAFGLAAAGAQRFRNIRRATRAQRAVAQETAERAKQQSAGLLVETDDGAAFAPDALQPPPPLSTEAWVDQINARIRQVGAPGQPDSPGALVASPPAAPSRPAATAPMIEGATTETFGKAPPAPLPEGDPGVDPWLYDPELPESTALGKLVGELSDREIRAALQAEGTPVVERINQIVESRAGIAPPPATDGRMALAPAASLSPGYTEALRPTLNALEDWQLRGLFDQETNPDLWRKAQALTGVDEPDQLTKTDMLDAAEALAAEGRVPLAGRLTGDRMMPVDQIGVAPQALQYKSNVDSQGRQAGNSLEGINRWNPNAEGSLAVWRDAAGEIGPRGQFYVADGHNRLAKAKELGIPSLPVREIVAPNAAAARLQAADANISAGQGTVFDAAKMAREMGITSPADMAELGKPGASGFWRDGINLARLPEDVFTGAINGQISARKASIIGGSGADDQTMRSAFKWLLDNPNTTEGRLQGMLDMARSAPQTPSSAGRQTDLLSGTAWGDAFNAGMLAKADLADEVRAMLGREKRLFKAVGDNAGQVARVGTVDSQAASSIASEAGRAQQVFGEAWYKSGPISSLLDEGAQRVVAGESPAAVAQGLKNRLVAAVKKELGANPPPATDAVQGDMLAAVADATPAPLTPDARGAAEMRLLREAIANGEVRPPDAPIPDLPEPSLARLDQLSDNAPAAPGAEGQAMADELRLAVEHARADAALQAEARQAARDELGYELLSFEEKKQLGMGAELGKPMRPSVPGGAATAADAPADPPRFELPPELRQAKPRYGTAQLVFASDLDRAAYILFNDSVKPSKAAPKFRAAVEAAGLDMSSVVEHGRRVKAAIKQLAGGGAPQGRAVAIEVPAQAFSAVAGDPPAGLAPPPARPMQVRVSESDYSAAPRGWTAADISRLSPDDIAIRQKAMAALIKKVAGEDVAVRFEDTYVTKTRPAQWGGDGSSRVQVAGSYNVHEDLITLAGLGDSSVTLGRLVETAYHEAFHRIQYVALGEKEAKVLDTLWARLKTAIGSNHVDGTTGGRPIAYAETQAVAFQRYAGAIADGKDPVFALLGGYDPNAGSVNRIVAKIGSMFDRILDFGEKVSNYFANGTFDSTRSIFERARRGALAAAEGFEEPMAGIVRMHDTANKGGWRSTSWDLRSIQGRITENDAQIENIRRKAQQDGC